MPDKGVKNLFAEVVYLAVKKAVNNLNRDTEVTRLNDLQTQVRLVEHGGPPRYFVVQVREVR